MIAQRWTRRGTLGLRHHGYTIHLTGADCDLYLAEYAAAGETPEGDPFELDGSAAALGLLERARDQGRPGVRLPAPKKGRRLR